MLPSGVPSTSLFNAIERDNAMLDRAMELRVLVNRGQELLGRITASLEPEQVTRFNSSDVANWFNKAKDTLDRVAPAVGETLHRFESRRGAFTLADIRGHRDVVVDMLATLKATLDSQADLISPGHPVPPGDRAYDVFVSFSSQDGGHAERLAEEIRKAGGTPFLAAKDIAAGDDFAERIRDALEASGELWMLVTPHSLTSEWVMSEWGAAWALRKRIVPILLRCAPQQLPDRLQRLQCIDYHQVDQFVIGRFEKPASPHR
jgi:hypothetical protein